MCTALYIGWMIGRHLCLHTLSLKIVLLYAESDEFCALFVCGYCLTEMQSLSLSLSLSLTFSLSLSLSLTHTHTHTQSAFIEREKISRGHPFVCDKIDVHVSLHIQYTQNHH